MTLQQRLEVRFSYATYKTLVTVLEYIDHLYNTEYVRSINIFDFISELGILIHESDDRIVILERDYKTYINELAERTLWHTIQRSQ